MTCRGSARRGAILVVLLSALAACEDQIVDFKNHDGGVMMTSSGSAGSGSFSIGSTMMGTGGFGATGTSFTGSDTITGFGGSGGGPICVAGGGSFQMQLDRFDSSVIGCGAGIPMNVELLEVKGTVIASDGVTLQIDECPPPMGTCPPQITTLTYFATGLSAFVPVGNFVDIEIHVHYEVGGCVQRLQITDLPIWNGVQNPGGSLDATLWLAAADGTPEPFADAPFDVGQVALGCTGGTDGIDVYSLYFNLVDDQNFFQEVHQNHQRQWQVPVPPMGATWVVHNLRSYQSANINDTTNWAYWLAPLQVMPD